jgi:hypothetical protein
MNTTPAIPNQPDITTDSSKAVEDIGIASHKGPQLPQTLGPSIINISTVKPDRKADTDT